MYNLTMITFSVGKIEKHIVSFSYDSFWGKAQIMVDGKEYSSSRVIFVGHTPFSLQVGEKEKHNVRIELDNPYSFAFRGSNVKVFVDDEMVQQVKVPGHGGKILLTSFGIVFLVFLIVFLVMYLLMPGALQL